MATLVDEGLFKYLDNLKKEVSERREHCDSEDSLQHLVHSQMQKVIDAEKRFLKYQSSNSNTQAMFYVSQTTGLPSVDSLKPDLENMCQLTEEEPDFKDIAEKYQRGVKIRDKKRFKKAYRGISEKEWKKKLDSYDSKDLVSKIGFDFSASNDGNFEIILKESFHINGNDKYCKEFPVLTREGRMKYCYVLNSLLSEFKEDYHVLKPQAVQKFRKKDALAKRVGTSNILRGVAKDYGFSANKNLKVLREGVKECGYHTGTFIRSTVVLAAAPFIASSAVRILNSGKHADKYLGRPDGEYINSSLTGMALGGLAGLTGLVATTLFSPILGSALQMEVFHILAIPAIPNLISGTYEIGRKICMDANKRWLKSKQKLIEKPSQKALRDSNE